MLQTSVKALRLAWLHTQQPQLLNSIGALAHYSVAAPKARTSPGDVPEGHKNSDLSSWACNISLGRRRDLTLRQDLRLHHNGVKKTLGEIFKGKKAILVGFPGGPVCTEKHIPGYVQAMDQLSQHGVDKVVCVTVDSPERVEELASDPKLQHSKVEVCADPQAGFMRLLGLELAEPSAVGEPRSQRFAGIMEDGILLRVCIERQPGELKVSDVDSMARLWDDVFPR